MKVLLVIDSLGSGGAQRQIVNLAIGLSQSGLIVELIYYNNNEFYIDKLIEHKITIHKPTNSSTGFSIKFLHKLRKTIKQDFDFVISFLSSPSIYSFIASFGIIRCNHIVCVRNSSVYSKISFLNYLTMLFSHKVVTNSYHESINIKKLLGLHDKTHTIWNGYESIYNGINFNKEQFNSLLVIARISEQKNGIALMKALKIFLDRNGWCPKIRWAGRRDSDFKSKKIAYEMDKFLVDHDQIKKNWYWLGETSNIDELFDTSDALISPSIYEGLPNVICESMLKGCNVLASNICDNPRLLKNGELGLLFNPNDPEDICKVIENYYSLTQNDKNIIANKALRFAKSELSIKKMVSSYQNILK